MVCSALKSHVRPPVHVTERASTRHASYMACGGSRSPERLSGSPMKTLLAISVCDIARVPPCPRPMIVIRDIGTYL